VSDTTTSGILVSNDSREYFGNVIERRTLLWAIRENIVCDYVVQTISTNEAELIEHFVHFKITTENDKRMFLAAYSALKSVQDGKSHHILVYVNNTANTSVVMHYIKLLLADKYFTLPK
jgi:hypothetical protein